MSSVCSSGGTYIANIEKLIIKYNFNINWYLKLKIGLKLFLLNKKS